MPINAANDVVVLDIGGTHIRIGHIQSDKLCKQFEVHETQILRVEGSREVLASTIKRYVEMRQLRPKATVLGIPAVLDRQNDNITHCNNIPQLEGHGLKRFLSASLNCRVILEQDIMLQVLGEWQAGAAQQQSSIFGIYFGTGIGSAYLLNGNPENNLVQDIQAGHIPIMADGLLCQCGNTDCVEAYACGHTLMQLARETDCPIEDLFYQRKQAFWKPLLDDKLDRFILYQSYLLATICTLFTPGVLLIGGGIPQMPGYPKEELLMKTCEHLQKPHPAQTVNFRWASLASCSALHGAQALLDQKQT